MEFTSSYFHAFGNPDLAAVVSGDGGSAQAHRPRRSTDGAKAEDGRSPTTTTARRAPSMFCVPDTEAEEPNGFLDECTLCRKALCGDIFMYRGDTPFCSDDCRREQIDMDRIRHRRKKQQALIAQQQQQQQAAAAAAMAQRDRRTQRQLQPQH
ncbi:uncharacterized protein LOC103627565 [Zea mays]|uniref:FLZ-type domain-containing protein n=1 Tax=Zea mays TaxID=4577 RepID=A0A1D6HG74_MAIZE|nr:uncharacterized protein LOC103627565 [Zea mays]AQK73624.1 hypothetical protein ZEAMMB73_Zm00001d017647 [Zea mays]|eukprot:NP_001314796.1 uncharacterized protein LOC103627565 [Zea mays]